MIKQFPVFFVAFFLCLFIANDASAFGGYPLAAPTGPPQPLVRTAAIQATGWAPDGVIVGPERQYIKSMDILQRPNRPFHFYGNAVRFFYYRQQTNYAY